MKRIVAAVLLAGLAGAPAARAAKPEGQEKFSAYAVDLGGRYGASTSHVRITVNRWSTPDERKNLEAVLAESGPDGLLAALQKTEPVGRIYTTGNLGYDLRFAYQMPLATGGRKIVVGTDRPLSFYEASRRPRSVDYPFTVLEMRVDETGHGQGNLVVAGKVTAMGDTIELENYTTTPLRLMQVRLDK
jgi:opacity protein-like surface antigen